jgi:hypothetical protein
MITTTLAFLLGAAIFYAGFRFGRYTNDGDTLTLEGQNSFLSDEVNFLKADNEHLRKVLERRVQWAHVEGSDEMTDLRDGPPYTAAIGLCFHGVSLSEHCGECALGQAPVFGLSS